ncbi:MAG: cytochrome c [Proteobacteria bacterium]|nr:cytochrome c [Pseudomonadota bacterium]
MKLLFTIIALCASISAQADPFPGGNAQTGKALFDKYKCNSCHEQMVGDGGNAIFTRTNRKVHNPAEMFAQFKMCSANIGVTLSAQEEQHMGAYLNKYYKFK